MTPSSKQQPPDVGVSSEPGHRHLQEDPIERELDEALQETFPASDPVALTPDVGQSDQTRLDDSLKNSFPASDPVAVRTSRKPKD